MFDLCLNVFKRVNISFSLKCLDLDSFRFVVGMFWGWGGCKVIIVFWINLNLFIGNVNS